MLFTVGGDLFVGGLSGIIVEKGEGCGRGGVMLLRLGIGKG